MGEGQETVDDIIAEARDKYTVHECNQCAWRKCCSKGFGSEECGKFRESIFLRLGIEDGYFTQLLDRLEAAHRREAQSIERIIRDAIIDYTEQYPHAPNDDVERELIARANTANEWLKQHGFAEEPTNWSKEEMPCL